MALLEQQTNELVEKFLLICHQINFLVAIEKTEWASTLITFLGMLVNSLTQTISIPIAKRDKAIHLLWNLLLSKKTTELKLHQLMGLLNHIGRAVLTGRCFDNRYAKFTGRKQRLHVQVDREMKLDSLTWLKFL